jgi:hypothetical protein
LNVSYLCSIDAAKAEKVGRQPMPEVAGDLHPYSDAAWQTDMTLS